MSSGGLRGLQILQSGANPVRGGFDSHTFPPLAIAVAAAVLVIGAPALARSPLDAPADTTAPAPADTAAPARADTVAFAPADTVAARAPAAAGAEPDDDGLPPSIRRHGPSPSGALFRSLIVPGWGQLANGKPVKAAIVASVEGALLAGMVYEKIQADDARERSREADTEEERQEAIGEKNRHLNRRDNYGWWSLAAVLYSIADAYVDAHLAGYDEEWRLNASLDPEAAGARLGLAVVF